MLESTLPAFDLFGKVRERSGAALPGIVPTNTYPCLGERWIALGANSDALYGRLGRGALGPLYKRQHADDVEVRAHLDNTLRLWRRLICYLPISNL